MRVVTFASGSSGNCTLLSVDDTHVLIDAGISMRRIKTQLGALGLTPLDLSGVFVTHEHRDHIAGLQTMIKSWEIPIFAPRTVANHLRWTVVGVDRVLREIPVGEIYPFLNLSVRAFLTPHDTDMSVGYRVETADGIFAFSTDMGTVTEDVLNGLTGADIAVIEANHDVDMLRYGGYPYFLKQRILSDHGHLSNDCCAELAVHLAQTGTGRIILGHLSRENNTPVAALSKVRQALDAEGLERTELYIAPASEQLCVTI
jgi:phosphoribosyl 1,2-cyclic phosphodiesterase